MVSFGTERIGKREKNGSNVIENIGSKKSKKIWPAIFAMTLCCDRSIGYPSTFGKKMF